MTAYVALLRAVNLGGTGKLPMSELAAMCEGPVKAKLENASREYAGKPVGVMVRTAAEIAAVKANNPFSNAAPNRTVAIFLDAPPPHDTQNTLSGRRNEEVALGVREIYVRYGDDMGTSKLKISAAKVGTARNMNTIAKLAEMAARL